MRLRLLRPLLPVAACGLTALGLYAQQPSESAGETPSQEEGQTEPASGEEDAAVDDLLDESETGEEDLAYIDDLLAGDEDVLEGAGFTYDDGGRRDPFRSLLEVAERTTDRGPRPEGIPGLLIDEITVTGVWITVDGPVAQVRSADKALSLLLRPGDQLYDGDVVSISYRRYEGGEVVFKQIIDDPTAPKPFREVTRTVEP